MSKSPVKAIGAIIVLLITVIMFLIYCPIIGSRSLDNSSDVTNTDNHILLASLNGEIGRLDVETHSFKSLYDDIYVGEIVGIINNKEIVFLGCSDSPKITDGIPEGISPYRQGLYKVDLDDLNTTCFAERVDYAYLAPNKKEIAYITYPDYNLEYINIESMAREHIADSIGYFNKSNIWSPDSTKLVLVSGDQSDKIGILDITTQKYTPLLISQDDTIFLNWLDQSHLLIKIQYNNQQCIASFDFKSQKLLYYFDKHNNVYNAMCAKDSIIGLKTTDSQGQMEWVVLIYSQNFPYTVNTLFTIPCKIVEEKYVFFSDLYPISETDIFYRVLECETHRPVYCGIVNLNTKAVVELDTGITSIREL